MYTLSEAQAQRILGLEMLRRGNLAAIPSVNGRFPWECDMIVVSKAGFLTEYEIKTSRADLLADFRKRKHRMLKMLADGSHWKKYPNAFHYVLFNVDYEGIDFPDYAGLTVVTPPAGDHVLSPWDKEWWGRLPGPMPAHEYEPHYRFRTIKRGKKWGQPADIKLQMALVALGASKLWRTPHRWCRSCAHTYEES